MKILIVDTDPRHTPLLEPLLLDAGFTVLGFVSAGQDLYRLARELQPDVILTATDSPARDTLEHLALIARNMPRPLLLLAAQADAGLIHAAADSGLSFYVVPQLSAAALTSLILTATMQFAQQQQLARDLQLARQRLEDRRLIDLAKCRLMERERLPEADAYKRLQREAMRANQRMVDVARRVLAAV